MTNISLAGVGLAPESCSPRISYVPNELRSFGVVRSL